MKNFYFVITGELHAKVKARTKQEAYNALMDNQEDCALLRNWEVMPMPGNTEPDGIDMSLDTSKKEQ